MDTAEYVVEVEGPDEYYVEGSASASLRANGGKDASGKQGNRVDKQPMVVSAHPGKRTALEPASEEAMTLSAGSHPDSNAAGRHREDDFNLVVQEEPSTFDWQAGGGGNDDSFRGKSRTWIDDKPGAPARALTRNKTLAVHVPAEAGGAGRSDPVSDAAASQTPHPGSTMPAPPASEPVIFEARVARNGRGAPEEIAPPLKAQSGETGKGDSAPLVAFDWTGDDPGNTPEGLSPPLPAGHAGEIAVATGFIAGSSPATGGVGAEEEIAPTMGSQSNGSTRTPTVAYTKTHGSEHDDDPELWAEAEAARTLGSVEHANDVVVEPDEPTRPAGAAVRRLSPVECSRLQGLPDHWTELPGDKPTPDGPQYAALGDAVTVPVPLWIVGRLVRREQLS